MLYGGIIFLVNDLLPFESATSPSCWCATLEPGLEFDPCICLLCEVPSPLMNDRQASEGFATIRAEMASSLALAGHQ